MLTTTATDGTNVIAADEGQGPVVLVIHPGLDDGRSWARVAQKLTPRFRVVRPTRRQYRVDLPGATPCTIADEVRDIQAIAAAIGEPTLIVGHSSGGVVALEAMLASPELFVGGIIYEPPVVTDLPLGGEAIVAARAAVTAGKPGRAMRIFLRDIVRTSPALAVTASILVSLNPRWRALVPHQIDDNEAIDALGNRLEQYARIELSTILLGGEKSQAHLKQRLDALAHVMRNATSTVLAGQGHSAHLQAPDELARLIATFADDGLFHQTRPR